MKNGIEVNEISVFQNFVIYFPRMLIIQVLVLLCGTERGKRRRFVSRSRIMFSAGIVLFSRCVLCKRCRLLFIVRAFLYVCTYAMHNMHFFRMRFVIERTSIVIMSVRLPCSMLWFITRIPTETISAYANVINF